MFQDVYIFFRHLRIWTWKDPDIYVYRPGMFQSCVYIDLECSRHIRISAGKLEIYILAGTFQPGWKIALYMHIFEDLSSNNANVLKEHVIHASCPQKVRLTYIYIYIYIYIYT